MNKTYLKFSRCNVFLISLETLMYIIVVAEMEDGLNCWAQNMKFFWIFWSQLIESKVGLHSCLFSDGVWVFEPICVEPLSLLVSVQCDVCCAVFGRIQQLPSLEETISCVVQDQDHIMSNGKRLTTVFYFPEPHSADQKCGVEKTSKQCLLHRTDRKQKGGTCNVFEQFSVPRESGCRWAV